MAFKTGLIILVLFSSQAFAKVKVKTEFNASLNNLLRISSLDIDNDKSSVLQISPDSGKYEVEIEKSVDGFAGPILENDLIQPNIDIGLGIEFTTGFTFSRKKIVENKSQIKNIKNTIAKEYFYAQKIVEMEKDEKIHLNFYAGIILAPQISNIGIWAVVQGGWDVTVLKQDNNHAVVEFALIDSKSASFYFDKFGAMLSYNLAKDLENGFTLKLNLADKVARESYERLFKGNIIFAQKESLKNKNIKFEKTAISKSIRKGTGVWIRTPFIAWFLLNSTKNLVSGEQAEFLIEEKSDEKKITSSYEEESEINFFTNYHAKKRSFESSYNLMTKKYELADKFEIESNVGADFRVSLFNMLTKTHFNDFFNFEIPAVKNNYFHVNFEVKYTEEFFHHLRSGKINTNFLKQIAMQKLEAEYEVKFQQLIDAKLDPTGVLMARQFDQQLVTIGINKIIKFSNLAQDAYQLNDRKNALDNISQLMKAVYRSSYLYYSFVEYSKHCGSSLNLTIESEAFKKRSIQKNYLTDSYCSVN
jgi:hypothetical protein